METLLLSVAFAFAFVNGVNDGGSLLAVGLSVRSIRPLVGVIILTVAIVITPLVLGTGVATTLSVRLVGLDGEAGQTALLVAVVVAAVVSFGLSRRGLPTSLTLALVGAIAGVGVGAGLAVSWPTVWLVMLLAGIAPLVGILVGWLLSRTAALVSADSPLHRRVRRWHVAAFGLQCVAYGANDGQKMLAVMAVAAGTIAGGVSLVPWQLASIGVMFLLGAVMGLPRLARTLGGGLVPLQPPDAVVTELSSAAVVLGTGAIGAPVSMTQAISGGLVGTGITRGYGRIRWGAVVRVGGAWLLTLPAAFGLAALVAFVVV